MALMKGSHRWHEAYRPSLLKMFFAGVLYNTRYSDQFHMRCFHGYCITNVRSGKKRCRDMMRLTAGRFHGTYDDRGSVTFMQKKVEPGVLKNAIESADYYPIHVNAGRTFCVSFQRFVSSLRVLAEPRLWSFFIAPSSFLIRLFADCVVKK